MDDSFTDPVLVFVPKKPLYHILKVIFKANVTFCKQLNLQNSCPALMKWIFPIPFGRTICVKDQLEVSHTIILD